MSLYPRCQWVWRMEVSFTTWVTPVKHTRKLGNFMASV